MPPVSKLILRATLTSLTVCAAARPRLHAQVVPADKARLAVCRHYDFNQNRCDELNTEFTARRFLQSGSAGALDPLNAVDDFAREQTARAYADHIAGELGSTAKQRAEQAVSTYAATTQVGAGAGQSGATNLVSKPTTTDFLSAAAELGGFTDTQNGTTVSLQANANGLIKYLGGQAVFGRKTWSDTLQPLDFTVTLTVNQSSTNVVPTAGSANSLTPLLTNIFVPSNNTSFSGFEARYVVYRKFNPRSAATQALFQNAIAAHQANLNAATSKLAVTVEDLTDKIEGNQDVLNATSAFVQQGAAAETSGDFEALVHAYRTYYDAYVNALRKSANLTADVLTLNEAERALDMAVQQTVLTARGTPLATVTYDYKASGSTPDMHAFTAISSYLFKGGRKGEAVPSRTFSSGAQFTANFTASLYASVPAGAVYGRLRDLQASAEFDKPFGGTSADPRGTWSLAGYGQYQYKPTVLNITAGNLAPGTNITLPGNAQVLVGTTGWLGVVQGKLAINLNRGLTLPIAIKWSNKTNLLDANDIRGQIGLSYDLSALSRLIAGGGSSGAERP